MNQYVKLVLKIFGSIAVTLVAILAGIIVTWVLFAHFFIRDLMRHYNRGQVASIFILAIFVGALLFGIVTLTLSIIWTVKSSRRAWITGS